MIEKIRFGENIIAVLTGLAADGWNVLAVLEDVQSHNRLVIPGRNIVTNNGDKYYAQKSVGETPTIDFTAGGVRLGSSATAPTKADNDVTTFLAGTGHVEDTGYPKTADADPDNTGALADAVTWRFSYTTTEGNATGIQEGALCNSISAPTAALTHFLFAASFNKTSSNTLKLFINHTFNGV